MKITRFLVTALLIISLSGCIVAFKNVNEENLGEVSIGMNKEEVVTVVGEPLEKREQVVLDRDYDIWIYPVERFFARKYNALGYVYYEILFLNDKVKEWNRTQMYSQPKYELKQYETPEGARTLKILTEDK